MDFQQNFIHPTKDIVGIKSNKLKGKTICICLTGSVAIINTPSIARELMRHGAKIVPVMSKEAIRLIQPMMMEWSTGNEVITDISGKIEHISIAGERDNSKGIADMILICPGTANSIGKIANGISDNAVSAISMVALGNQTPIVIIPAMHDSMFKNPIVQSNIQNLKKLNVKFIGPKLEENKAKGADVEKIVDYVIHFFSNKKDLLGKKFLITAGPSIEWIDNVRYITNPSTGKMGIALVKEIISRGGDVTLFKGNIKVNIPIGIDVHNLESTKDFIMVLEEILKKKKFDVLISTAALADFTPENRIDGKITSDIQNLQINLISTSKFITEARNLDKNLFIVAFKAENNISKDQLIEKAYKRLLSSKSNLIIANFINIEDKSRGFGSDTNEVYIINKEKNVDHITLTSKIDIASAILDKITHEIQSNL